MNADCQWMTRNLEAYFCDALNAEDFRRARTHIETCADCSKEVQTLNAIDPLIRTHFRRQLAIAQAPRRRSSAVIYGSGALVAAALLLFAVVLRTPQTMPPAGGTTQPEIAAAPHAGDVAPAVKSDEAGAPSDDKRAKPQPPVGGTAAPVAGPLPVLRSDAPEFLVVDPAGYSRRLQDYRGYVLVLGVWTASQDRAIENMERIYQMYSVNTRLRFLGVSSERMARPANTSFPLAYNQGSHLLNAQPGDFVVVDEAGSVRLRGSLVNDFDDLVSTLQN